MLENLNENFHLKFQIQFGNLKKEIKENYYLATDERAFENKVATCMFIVDKDDKRYAMAIVDVMGVDVVKYINLDYFEEWHYVKI